MGRAEFEVKDEAAIEVLLAECEYGTLSLIDGSEPYGCLSILSGTVGQSVFTVAKRGEKLR